MFYAIDFRAESFLWNMVRRIVWMISEGSTGRMPVDSIGPKSPGKPVRVGLSRPEYLVLMDIDCGVEFPTDEKAVLGISHALVRRMREHSMRLEFAKTLLDSL
jgi:tRNA U38,U39,U40 pseudouridine synthase TruA